MRFCFIVPTCSKTSLLLFVLVLVFREGDSYLTAFVDVYDIAYTICCGKCNVHKLSSLLLSLLSLLLSLLLLLSSCMIFIIIIIRSLDVISQIRNIRLQDDIFPLTWNILWPAMISKWDTGMYYSAPFLEWYLTSDLHVSKGQYGSCLVLRRPFLGHETMICAVCISIFLWHRSK